jgi:type I restriction enzyme, S subunit
VKSHWKTVKLPEVAELNPRRLGNPPQDKEFVSFVPMKAVEEESGRLSPAETRPWGDVKKGYTPFQEGDVLFAKITPCMENGKYAIAKDLHEGRAAGSTEFHVFRPSAQLDAQYLLNFLFSHGVRQAARMNMRGAAGQLRVPASFFEELEIPLAPLPEQQRIVAEIEKQFTRLEAGLAGLRRVQANLKRYRAAVLKAACEGKLVPNEVELAKAEGRKVETGAELLERILAERHKNWTGRGKYREPTPPDYTSGRPLPPGWTLATVQQLSTVVQYGTSAKTTEQKGGVPVLRMGNIVDGKLVTTQLKFLPENHAEFPELLLAPGDILFNRTNSAELVGKTAVFRGNPSPCSFASYLIRARLCNNCLPDFVVYYINSIFGRAWVASCVSQQVGQANVNGTKLQALAIPLPPLAEQTRIVAEVERRLSVIDELEAVTAANIQRATRLRQSILQRAFTGELV